MWNSGEGEAKHLASVLPLTLYGGIVPLCVNE